MAKKQGICRNIDCDNYKQIVEVETGEEFECPLCHQHLDEAGTGGSRIKNGGGDDPIRINWKLIGIIAVAVVILAGVGYGVYSLMGGQKIDKIKLDKKSVTLVVGQKEVIKATVVDKDGKEIKDAKVTYKWTVKDEKIASITQGGEVAALKKGKTSITVKIEGDDKLRATCQVEVIKRPGEDKEGRDEEPTPEVLVSSLSVANAKISIKEGETASLGLSVQPENATEGISAESSNPDVASIEDGTIKANKAGKAIITISTEKSGKSVTISVNVTKEDSKGGGQEPPKPKGRYHGTLNLGYGSYSGDILNGKPDGAGVLTYKGHQKAGRNFKTGEDVYAESGERVDGTWANGYLSSGTLFKKDGNAIKIKY